MPARDIRWRLHLRVPPERVYPMIATDEGRARWWARRATREGGHVLFEFADGTRWRGRILGEVPPERFEVDYLGGPAAFTLAPDGLGGTDLALEQCDVAPDAWAENLPGWVSVLLVLKAAVEHGIDLRNHDPARTWTQGYVDA